MSAQAVRERVAVDEGVAGGTIVRVDAGGAGAAGWADDVQGPSAQVIDAVNAHVAATPAAPLVVTVTVAGAGRLEEALVQAVRGIVGTAALEISGAGGRASTVVASASTLSDDVRAVEEYLLDEARGGYTTGATIDLRGGPVEGRADDGAVLVTGAAGGLGFAAAEAIAGSGRRVVLTDRAGDALTSAGERLGMPTVACDLTRPEQLAALAASPELEGLDAVVVHHGVGASTRFGADYDRAASDRSLVLNGTTVFDVVELLLPRLRPRGGTVVILSSQAGLTAEAGNGPYCAAKFAVMGYVTSLAQALAGDRIAVHGLCPGPVDTPLMRAAFAGFAIDLGEDPEEFTARRLAAIPLGRAGDPQQIGASTALLLRLHATGVVLAPTGGETLS
ncbi:SDR family NAD(P)-dependent oxidoreductase [Microbacterium sp. No. 7]|uniref:SDR family NAD(P)-dependent oxidoreductase n=1 Tax=Microbacterium sp. No. 7 TaxID=1714373 RepID=UPI0006D24D01|nr:SDR family oxidoreductase [Microbacterium sp. No. 7]ALJ21762.1 hypothetical protein AOA12_18435 [Microbacterium sp. No. 7]